MDQPSQDPPDRSSQQDTKAANRKSYRAAMGELVEDEGGVKVKAEDEYGQVRGMKGRIADIHKPLLAAGECTDMGQKIWLADDGGWMVVTDGGCNAQRVDG